MDTLSVDALQKLIAEKTVIVLDVRRRSDFEADARTIPGAAWQDPDQLETWADSLSQKKPVAIYCARGGSVSRAVHAALTEKGLDVKYLEGGLAAWDAART